MKRTRPTTGQSRWRRSSEFRLIAVKAIRRWNRLRETAPKCGARRKHDGEPCQNLPLANGRCRFHGGLTPRGDQWHKPQLPSSPEKLRRKLADRERKAKKRAARLARMTPEERKQHERWHRTHKPGSAEARAAQRIRRKQDVEARWLIEKLQKASAKSKEAPKREVGQAGLGRRKKPVSGGLRAPAEAPAVVDIFS